jgi:hypothetical protein
MNETYESTDESEMKEYMAALSIPRRCESQGYETAREYIIDKLRSFGYDVMVEKFDYSSSIKNLIDFIFFLGKKYLWAAEVDLAISKSISRSISRTRSLGCRSRRTSSRPCCWATPTSSTGARSTESR